jgi:hypothetical protein
MTAFAKSAEAIPREASLFEVDSYNLNARALHESVQFAKAGGVTARFCDHTGFKPICDRHAARRSPFNCIRERFPTGFPE